MTAYIPSSNNLKGSYITWKGFIACSLMFLKLLSLMFTTNIEGLISTGLGGKMRCPCKYLGTSSLVQREKFDVFIGAVVNSGVFSREGYFSNSKRAH